MARSRATSLEISAARSRARETCSLISRMRLSCSSRKVSVIADSCSGVQPMSCQWWLGEVLHTHEHASRGAACSLRYRADIERQLPPVSLLACSRQLAIGLIVDDGPARRFLEREVDHALEQRSLRQREGNRRLT